MSLRSEGKSQDLPSAIAVTFHERYMALISRDSNPVLPRDEAVE